MLLSETFRKSITRPIDPVVKASDTDTLADELDEFVLTNEVKLHLHTFFDEYNDASATANGAWISGFFGSGKSHLLKILSAVLENRQVGDVGAAQRLIDVIGDDDRWLGDQIRHAVDIHPSESILFNIDAVAPNEGRTRAAAILAAFTKVFNARCGYFDGDAQHIAQLERDLDREGRLEAFRECVFAECGKQWEEVRGSALMFAPKISRAYDEACGNPAGTTRNVITYYKDSYTPSIRSFAEQVRDYIATKPRGFRLNFFVDEVGQFIAKNDQLMINLQTIAEELNTLCGGDSWIVVTSQESMDDIVGEMSDASGNAFSKIQARFAIKMTLTSQEAKEVIKERLLAKTSEATPLVAGIYYDHRDDFRMLFDFVDGKKQYRGFAGEKDFVRTYPFVPYQFDLFIESMKGLNDQHAFPGSFTSIGARSMLGVFQGIAKDLCQRGTRVEDERLASFDLMFEGLRPSIQTERYAAISQAEDLLSDNPLAVRCLKALFLVKYVPGFSATAANLRVLLYGGFGESPKKLEGDIREALEELSRQTYVRREANGIEYSYLTNEEKEVEREIKNVTVSDSELRKLVGEVFDDVAGQHRVSYTNGEFRHTYTYNLQVDGDYQKTRSNDLNLNLITALTQVGIGFVEPAAPKTLSVVLNGSDSFMQGVRTFKQTESYVQRKGAEAEGMRAAIIQQKRASNSELRASLVEQMRELLKTATWRAHDTTVTTLVKGVGADAVATGMLELIRRSYTGLQQLTTNYSDKVIYDNCLGGNKLLAGSVLPEYCQTVLNQIGLFANMTVTVAGDNSGSLTSAFAKGEYGWPEIAVRCALAVLYGDGKIELRLGGKAVEGNDLASTLARKQNLDKVTVRKVNEVDPAQLAALKAAYRSYSGTTAYGQDAKAVTAELRAMVDADIKGWEQAQGSMHGYPFEQRFGDNLTRMRKLVSDLDGGWQWALAAFPKQAEELSDIRKAMNDMAKFAKGSPMESSWRSIRDFLTAPEGELVALGVPIDDVRALKSAVEDPDCYRKGDLARGRATLKAARQTAESAIESLRERQRSSLDDYLASFRETYDLGSIAPEARAEFDAIFKAAYDRLETLHEVRDATELRGFVNGFKAARASQLDALATTVRVPEPAGDDEVVPPKPMPPKPKPTVQIRSIKARGYSKPMIKTPSDVDEYVAALRKEMLEAIASDKNISV